MADKAAAEGRWRGLLHGEVFVDRAENAAFGGPLPFPEAAPAAGFPLHSEMIGPPIAKASR